MRALAFVVAVLLVPLLLAGCPSVLPPVSGCAPQTTRCAPDGVPETCSSTRRWERHPTLSPCPAGAPCCPTQSPYGRALHACAPPERCRPEEALPAADGGAR